jgi:hypothetical protein
VAVGGPTGRWFFSLLPFLCTVSFISFRNRTSEAKEKEEEKRKTNGPCARKIFNGSKKEDNTFLIFLCIVFTSRPMRSWSFSSAGSLFWFHNLIRKRTRQSESRNQNNQLIKKTMWFFLNLLHFSQVFISFILCRKPETKSGEDKNHILEVNPPAHRLALALSLSFLVFETFSRTQEPRFKS